MTEETKAVKEPKVKEARAGHNSAAIRWPTDPAGATSSLKKGGIEAAKRINGDPEKLAKFKKVLRLILQHAEDKFEVDSNARKGARENSIAARARLSDTRRQLAEKKLKEAEARVETLRKAVK